MSEKPKEKKPRKTCQVKSEWLRGLQKNEFNNAIFRTCLSKGMMEVSSKFTSSKAKLTKAIRGYLDSSGLMAGQRLQDMQLPTTESSAN